MSYSAAETIPPQLIQDALQRVVGSRDFMNSERKRRFLKFVVMEALAGHAGRIKAYTIAVDVFDRDPSFDPATDPVVRIEAGRLRRCLEHYYLTEGAMDPIQITIPKGGYVPQFIVTEGTALTVPKEINPAINQAKAAAVPALAVAVSSNPTLEPSRLRLMKRSHPLAGILSLSVVLIIALLWGATLLLQTWISENVWTTAVQGPSLMVLPFSNDSGNPAEDIFANGMTEEVIGELIRFRNVLVFGADTSFRYRTEPALRDAVPDVRIDYVLKGSISRVGSQIQVNVALLHAADNHYLWSDRFRQEFSPGNMIDLRHDIAMQVARVLAQPHGVIHNEEFRNTAGHPSESYWR